MTPLTHTAAHARGNPHTYSFTGIIEGLKEVCGMMMTRFQDACLDIEAIVQKTLEEATQLNRLEKRMATAGMPATRTKRGWAI